MEFFPDIHQKNNFSEVMIERLEMKLTFNYCCSSYFSLAFPLFYSRTNLATTVESKAEFSSNNDNERFHDPYYVSAIKEGGLLTH